MDTSARPRPSIVVPHKAPALRAYGLLAALAGAAGLAGWLKLTPFSPWLAGGVLAAYVVLLLARPGLWLLILPALWPVADLSAWSGHIYFTESDALALATLLGLGLREVLAPPPVSLSGRAPVKFGPAALVVFGLIVASTVASGIRGLLPLPALDTTALLGYSSTLNALRIAKALVLALALIPFLHAAGRRDGDAALSRACAGLGLGLATCALAALWERLAFPGLSDFSAEYRTTALFWETHVGGAALDAWLVLSFPFAVGWLLQARRPLTQALAFVALCLGAYAVFTTFSRVVYGATVAGSAILGLALLRRPAPADIRVAVTASRPAALLGLCAVVLAGCFLAFQGGGYRGLGAFGGLVLVAYGAGGATHGIRAGQLVAGLVAGFSLLALTALAVFWVPKGAYVVYALSWLATAVAVFRLFEATGGPAGRTLLVALLVWTGANAVAVAAFWGGAEAAPGAALAVGLVLAASVVQALALRPLWTPRPRHLYGMAALLAAGGMAAATLGSDFMGSRLSSTRGDFEERMEHWRDSAGLLHGAADATIGLGLGRFPDAYYWHLPDRGFPGTVHLTREGDNRALLMGANRHPRGVGEPVRLSQQVPTDTVGPFRYRLRARAPMDVTLQMEICRKHLLYREDCAAERVAVKGGGAWQSFEGVSSRGNLPAVRAGLPRLTSFALFVDGSTDLEVDDLEVTDGRLRPLIQNGDFEHGPDFWFFTSDHYHLPWHAESMLLHVYVEQGVLGLVAMAAALLALLPKLLRRPEDNHGLTPVVLASLGSLLVVGTVNSLVDIPRLMFFAYLVLWLGLTLRKPPPA